MPRGKWKKRWFKVDTGGWLHGSIRWQFTSEERGVWIDFLAKASEVQQEGAICDNDGRPLPLEFLANQWNIKLPLLRRVIEMCLEEGRLEERGDVLWVTHYEEYQSEYERQVASAKKAAAERETGGEEEQPEDAVPEGDPWE